MVSDQLMRMFQYLVWHSEVLIAQIFFLLKYIRKVLLKAFSSALLNQHHTGNPYISLGTMKALKICLRVRCVELCRFSYCVVIENNFNLAANESS